VQVVQLDDVGAAKPRVARDAERGRVEGVLEVEPVEHLAEDPVGGAPAVVALDPPDVVVLRHLAADEHPRHVPLLLEPAMYLVRGARCAPGGV
jgi:hypothetical protein